jgi:hypothetical protein
VATPAGINSWREACIVATFVVVKGHLLYVGIADNAERITLNQQLVVDM